MDFSHFIMSSVIIISV
uniref:Uncharacterized protein n=1 Tax=Lepeophtheirus salmonis TaxID=72036 RepID=A0A0K2TLW7_LEPSM